jgi:hypothetical protein
MQQPDLAQFVEAMAKEIHNHESRDHWEIVHCNTIPPGHKLFKQFGALRENVFPMGHLINTKHNYVPTGACSSGASPTGRHTLRL